MKRISALILLGLIVFVGAPRHKVYADALSANCGQDAGSQVSALVKIPTDNPDLYVRASLAEDHVPATLYFQSLDDNATCFTLGSLTLTDGWQKIGTATQKALNTAGAMTLVLTDSAPNTGASAPQVLLASKTPPCDIIAGCVVAYKGANLNLFPKKISTSSDTLRVGLLSDPAKDSIKQVIYSVDGVQVYVDKKLQSFNQNYVSGGEHSIERTVILSSGQSLSDKQSLQKGNVADINYFFISLYSRYSRFIIFFGSIAAILLSWYIGLSIARAIYRRQAWKRNHIASTPTAFDPNMVGAQDSSKFQYTPFQIMMQHKKAIFIPTAVLFSMFLAFTFVITIFTVDGVSMFPTLQNKSKHPLLVLPAVLGKITGDGFTPARGTIVVVQKDDNNLFSETAVQQKSYVVKRVVGLPEERVVVKDGVVTIFNTQYPNGFIPDDVYHWLKNKPQAEYDRLDVTLKQGELFVMGDNRDESIDSRFYGPVKTTQIVGKVIL